MKIITPNLARNTLILSCLFLIIIFLINPHFIELTGVLETWIQYKGLTLYKDFFGLHFPLGRWVLFPFRFLFNWNFEVDPVLALIVGLLNLVVIYLFRKTFLTQLGTSVALIFFSIFFWFDGTGIIFDHEILIGLLLTILIYIYSKNFKKFNYKTVFGIGILISLIELTGQIVSLILGLLGLMFIFKIKSQKTELSKNLVWFFLGIALPFILISIFFYSKSALGEFLYYNTIYYTTYASFTKTPFWRLPLKELAAYYAPLLALIIIFLLDLITNINKRLFTLNFANPSLQLIGLGISTIPFILFSLFHPHHLSYALPVMALLAGLSVDKLKELSSKKRLIIYTYLLYVIIVFTTSILPWHLNRIIWPPSLKIANDTYPGDDMYTTVLWVKNNTPFNSKIMVLGDGMFYVRSDRLPASRPSRAIPYSWRPFDKIKPELLANPPDYWVIGDDFINRLKNDYYEYDMLDFVSQQLKQCYQQKLNNQGWHVWQRICK